MNGFLNWMEEHFMPVAARIGNQKHLVAIRDAFIAIMPITMVGSIAVLLNVFFRDLPNSWWGDGNSFVAAMSPLISVNGNVYFGSIVILSLAFSFALGYQIAKTYNVNPIAGGVIAFSAVVTCMNQSAAFDFTLPGVDAGSLDALKALGVDAVASGDAVNISVSGWGYMGSGYTGAGGLFTALIVGLLSSLIYVKLMIHKITIKMPDNVPPAVGNAFAAIIPGCVAIYVFGIITQICVGAAGMYPNELIQKWIQAPLMGLSQNMWSAILVSFLVQLLWFFGLHGSNVMAPFIEGVYTPALLENLAYFEEHHTTKGMPYVWTRGSLDAYAQMGGSGVTLGLLIAILIFSKRKDVREVGKLAAPMGVFNINEPIIFGLPIVLNPIYLIPWLLVPPVCTLIAYLFTVGGIIPPVYVQVPWVMPVGIYAFLATGGSIMAGVVALINLGVSFLIWTPFVLLANRTQEVE
ncbi:PTS sugar transporter subunit IIC [uncultured Dubosiella sp.]|jgi:PTS system cellobiose-specific IIC component|uniref:PTS sugar transporter subunit IIC n=1 Tax=uncultured Dubosiella sp. TaxID=1937011 RepID=UPI00208B0B8A|nr:PTS sugar transporter subunit IIC [uncultured Dubosiella sp.]GJM57077.1 permease IIC component [Erysipelotrichaceae bacterium OPF54]